MIYKLPDGKEIDLLRIRNVSSIRDVGLQENSIDKSILSFSIRMSGRETIEVKEIYHYADWAVATKKLKSIRNDILDNWHKLTRAEEE